MVDEACKEKTVMLENDLTLTTAYKVINTLCEGTILYYNLLYFCICIQSEVVKIGHDLTVCSFCIDQKNCCSNWVEQIFCTSHYNTTLILCKTTFNFLIKCTRFIPNQSDATSPLFIYM